jgi:hypothetical protein
VTEDPPTSEVDGTTSVTSVCDTASGGADRTVTEVPPPLAAPLADVVSTPVDEPSPLEPSVVAILVPAAEQPALPEARRACFFGRAAVLQDDRVAFERVAAPALPDFFLWTQTLRFAARVVLPACVLV